VKTHYRSLSHFDVKPGCDGQTDGQTQGQLESIIF